MENVKVVKVLGCGAMGTVLLVERKGCDYPLTIKAMNKSAMASKGDAMRRAQREKSILSRLDHPFLANLLDHLETDKTVALFAEYCPGGDLNALRLKQAHGAFSEPVIRFYAAEIVVALEYLHGMGIVYRDLKPENVLIRSTGHIMLTDFDLSAVLPGSTGHGSKRILARFKSSMKNTWKKSHATYNETDKDKKRICGERAGFVGTEEYVSPEMVSGEDHGFGVDWWALGVLMYEMMYGRTPFKGPTRRDTFYNILVKEPTLDGGTVTPLMGLILELLVKCPGDRLGTVGGASAVKSHEFFQGLDWNGLEHVNRPPFVPSPLGNCSSSESKFNRVQGSLIEDYVENVQTNLCKSASPT